MGISLISVQPSLLISVHATLASSTGSHDKRREGGAFQNSRWSSANHDPSPSILKNWRFVPWENTVKRINAELDQGEIIV
jgi:hypothetical protein